MREKVARQIAGRDFDIVKDGLDEIQVEAFVTEIISERDMLLQRQEHLNSLTKLAERSIAEADKLAEEIRREADEEARTKVMAIMAKAEQEAREVAEQKRGEILAQANKEAEAIKDKAQRDAELLLGQCRQRIQGEFKGMTQRVHSQLIAGMKKVMEQAEGLPVEWDKKLSELVACDLPAVDSEPQASKAETVEQGEEKPSPAAGEAVLDSEPQASKTDTAEQGEEKPSPAAGEAVLDSEPQASKTEAVEQSEEKPSPTSDEEDLSYRRDILAQLEQAWVEVDGRADSKGQLPSVPSDVVLEADKDKAGAVGAVLEEKEASASYEGTLVLDILPPLTTAQLVEIQKYLRAWPGIGITELGPNDNGYSITVVLEKPMQIIDVLKELPEVKDARECVPGEGNGVTSKKDGLKRIAITVC